MAEPKRSVVRVLVLPVVLATVLAFGLGAFLPSFLQDGEPLLMGLVVGWAFYAIGRGLLWWDVPRGAGAALQAVSAGAAVGVAAVGLLDALLDDGPGWPMTPWWALVLALSVGVYRAHRPMLKAARAKPPEGRLWGVFDRRELAALAVLVGGYAMAGLALHRLFSAFSPLVPSAGQALTLGVVAYALYGARLLLAFAAHDEAAAGGGFLAWFKANLLRNALVVVVLVAYGVYRDDLARAVPHFPLVEFGLGVSLFAFVLARLRAHLRRGAAAASTTSDARAHRQKVETLAEPDYDAVAGPVARFVETGRGQREYMETVVQAAGLDPRDAEDVLAPVRAHREPPPQPVLPYDAAVAAYLLGAFFACVGVFAALTTFADVPAKYATLLALVVAAFALVGMQAEARRRLRPWLGLAYAGAGLALLLGVFFLGLLDPGDAASLPGEVWLVVLGVSAVILGVPTYQAWRQERDLRLGAWTAAPRAMPAAELDGDLRRARSRFGIAAGVALGVYVVVPPLARWMGRLPFGMEGFPDFYAELAGVGAWGFLAVGVPALVRFAALRRARPIVLAEERRRRDARLSLHATVMSTLERV